MSKCKYVVVIGGNVSGLGKGLIASSIAANLDWLGYNVKYLKLDGYLNTDSGTMAPTEHGECFVTEDGLEADMDLGHFERFTGQSTSRKSSLTSGMLYNKVLTQEREGKYLGRTVQVQPHVTNEIISQMRDSCDFKVVEVGGTIGDIETYAFIEAVRQLCRKEKVSIVELVYVPWLACSKEWKTKLAQHAVNFTRSQGVDPDVLLARSDRPTPKSILNKIERFTDVPTFLAEDLDNVYKIPLNLWERGIIKEILKPLGVEINGETEANEKYNSWKNKIERKPHSSVTIGIAGKYENGDESYKSIVESLYHAGADREIQVNIEYIGVEDKGSLDIHGIIVPGGFGLRGIEEKISCLQYSRENNTPTLGICLGMQLMCVEYARNVLGIRNAISEEWGMKGTGIITYMSGQKNRDKGGSMRLGKIRSYVYDGPLREIYETDHISERHRHRLEFMMGTYRKYFTDSQLKIGATSSVDGVDDRLIEIVYLPEHPFYIGVQYHPELQSRFLQPHPLLVEFINKCNTHDTRS
jgi:CTP synthase